MRKLSVEIIVMSMLLLSNVSHAYTIVSQNLEANSYSASSSYNNLAPSRAFDGNWASEWNSGFFAGQRVWINEGWLEASPWIEVNLGTVYEITRIVLGVNQEPGYEIFNKHRILTSNDPIHSQSASAYFDLINYDDPRFEVTSSYDSGLTFEPFDGTTCNSERLYINFDFTDPISAQYIQIRTLAPYDGIRSESWIAWNEIQIMTDDVELPAYPAALPTPEPSTGLLVAAGAVGLGMTRLQKRKSRR